MTNKVSIQDVVNGTPAGKEAVQRAVEASIKDQDAMSAKAQAMRSDTNELETDKAIDAILELFNKQLPEEKESYQDDNPQEVGENQFYGLGLADIKSRIEE